MSDNEKLQAEFVIYCRQFVSAMDKLTFEQCQVLPSEMRDLWHSVADTLYEIDNPPKPRLWIHSMQYVKD